MTHHVLITGEHRSGTTLMARLLDAQTDARVIVDFLHIARYQDLLGVGLATPLDEAQKQELLSRFDQDCAAIGFQLDDAAGEFETLCQFYQQTLDQIGRSGIIGHKTTRAYDALPQLLDLVPTLVVVIMLRDPRAVTVSELRRQERRRPGNHSHEPILARWRDGLDKSLSLADRFEARTVLVRFEDLIQFTERAFQPVAELLGRSRLDPDVWEPDVLPNSSFDDVQPGLDRTPLFRWQGADAALLDAVESELADEMSKVGYQPRAVTQRR